VIRVDVADTGGGIAPDVMPHIFEPFYTTKARGKGTGLGLPIAARIVDAHRGTISVAPRAGGGTVFTVCLPALVAGVPRPELREAAGEPVAVAPAQA
jgi:signal transduction histidine kinase